MMDSFRMCSKSFSLFKIMRLTRLYNAKRICSTQHNNFEENSYQKNPNFKIIVYTLTGLSAYIFYKNKKLVLAAEKQSLQTGHFVKDLPTFSLKEVAEHNSKHKQIWVIYKNGVYNITSFVDNHPGGDKILLAAGKSIEPFWQIYTVHHNEEIFSMLEEMRIGNIKEEQICLDKDLKDPYGNEPSRHPLLVPVSKKPFNAESPPEILIDNFVTPNQIFFVRNHLPVPDIDANNYKLKIKIEGETKELVLDLNKLKEFPKYSVMATIMCAGNRRSEMIKIKPVKGLEWKEAAIGNAVWSGAKLRDVLSAAGITEKDREHFKHVQFEGYDTDITNQPYGASILFWRAVDEKCETIIAYEMNGEPIPRDHGYPVRVIIPGIVGARNVKWLASITVSDKESNSHWQQNDYKGFSPSTDWDTVDFTKSPAIQELPVISAICSPRAGDTVVVNDGVIDVKGYAWSGGGNSIVRVDVTVDEGKTWHTATLNQQPSSPPQHYSWTLWTVQIPVHESSKKVEVWVKAVDSNYNTQPETFTNIWNLRGVLNNAYHKITVHLKQY